MSFSRLGFSIFRNISCTSLIQHSRILLNVCFVPSFVLGLSGVREMKNRYCMQQCLILRSLRSNWREKSQYETKNNSRQNIYKHQKQGINIRDLERLGKALRKMLGWSRVFKEGWTFGEGLLGVTY